MSAAPHLAPLTLTNRVRGPWLAIPHDAEAGVASIVLAGDERCPDMWRRVDAGQPVAAGKINGAHLMPLSTFGIACSIYPHSRVLSVYRIGMSRARRFGHPAGGYWAREGAGIQRIKFPRTIVEQLKAAVKDCNTLGVVRA